MVVKLYKKLVPSAVRKKIYKLFLGHIVFFLKHIKIYLRGYYVFCFQSLLPKTELNKVYAFVGRHGLSTVPYPCRLKYKKMNIEAQYDAEKQLPYVRHGDKRLYFPRYFDLKLAADCYKALSIEQELESPHRYVDSYDELKGMTLLEIGAAEGMFSLNTIEYVKHSYLFECEEPWIDALHATFEPWKEKITIERKYVGNKTEPGYMTIDHFLKDKQPIDNIFIKMDIEGAELEALSSAEETIGSVDNISFAVCTYHKKEDPKEIGNYFARHGIDYRFTSGYLLFGRELRKALIRAKKTR